MSKAEDMNKAIRTIREECAEHEECKDCILSHEEKRFNRCIVEDIPASWEEIKEDENDT